MTIDHTIISQLLLHFIHYVQFALKHSDLSEPLQYDFVDVTREYYQNTFSELLEIFSTHFRTCLPLTKEYIVHKDCESVQNNIKRIVCKDETGASRKCTVEELMDECNALPHCAGFNSNGYLKTSISVRPGYDGMFVLLSIELDTFISRN